jgi:metal-responsive CopG/Arc/MetJ family transcriptional regulator
VRTVIDIPDEQVEILDRMAANAGRSRAALIREALAELISRRRPDRGPDAFFGLWQPGREDGLGFQERLRAEWPE